MRLPCMVVIAVGWNLIARSLMSTSFHSGMVDGKSIVRRSLARLDGIQWFNLIIESPNNVPVLRSTMRIFPSTERIFKPEKLSMP